MARYNRTFELTPEDVELIENALRENKQALSAELLETGADPLRHCEKTAPIGSELQRINALLGRLHDQKRFYRPREGVYVSG